MKSGMLLVPVICWVRCVKRIESLCVLNQCGAVLKVGWGGMGWGWHGVAYVMPLPRIVSPFLWLPLSLADTLSVPSPPLPPSSHPFISPSFPLPSSFLLPSFFLPSLHPPRSAPLFFFSFPSSFSSLPRSRSTAAVQRSSSYSSLAPNAFHGTSGGHRKWWFPAHAVTKTCEGGVREV